LKVHKRVCKISSRANNVPGFRTVNFWNDLPKYVVTADSGNVLTSTVPTCASALAFMTGDETLRTNNKISLQAHSLCKTEEDDDSLQDDLSKLTTWSQKWQMLFNTSKCKVLHIT